MMLRESLCGETSSTVLETHGSSGALPSMTIVTCVEGGPLEPMVLRMVESLRRWGGRFRDCPVLAISPRFGPPLARTTRRAFDSLGVGFRSIRPENPYPWNGFYNKPLAMVAAEAESSTELVAFLDADILILGEPEELALGAGEDFAASATNKTVGTSGPDDVNEPYWEAVCSVLGLATDDLPWVTTCEEKLPIRVYWNSGVFVYRRSTRFSEAYLDACARLIGARVISHASKLFFTDQVALSLAMVKAGLRWRPLTISHNYNVISMFFGTNDPADVRRARVFHYHDAMWPAYWPELTSMLEDTHPDVHEWLSGIGPLVNPSSKPWKAVGKALRLWRSRRYSAFETTCRAY